MNFSILKYKLRKLNLVSRLIKTFYFIVTIILVTALFVYSRPYLPEVLMLLFTLLCIGAFLWWRSTGFKLESIAVILFTLFILWVSLSQLFAGGRGLVGIDTYIETKYRPNYSYYVTECESWRFTIPDYCVVPGYPDAEKEANQIIKFLDLSIFIPLGLAALFYVLNKILNRTSRRTV